MEAAFAVWLTGLPASGKSTVAGELVGLLRRLGIRPAVLESDALRRVLEPYADYSDGGREGFYAALVGIGGLLVDQGIPVIFDATANRARYRALGRERVGRLIEVYVECPLKTCAERDPKGLYRRARRGELADLPGVQAEYEAPSSPDLVVHTDREPARVAAERIVAGLTNRGWVGGTAFEARQ